MPDAVQFVVPLALPDAPRSVTQLTCVTPTLSDAVPETVNGEDAAVYVVPEVGPLMVTVGAVVSVVGAEYVTVSESAPILPAASRAVMVITLLPVWSPIDGTLHVVVPDAVPLPPLLFDQVTDATPTLSAAVPPSDRLAVVDVNDVPVVGVEIEADGRVVSNEVAPVVTDQANVKGLDWSTPSDTLAVTE